VSQYEVVVGNVGVVHRGEDRVSAVRAFHQYAVARTEPGGRATGEPVTLMCDGEIIAETPPSKGEQQEEQ
jgi:hypothetical protein